MELTSVAWVAPKSVAPQHFVNRSRDVRRLMGILEDLCSAGTAGAKILVTGDRGVGKSIFTRHVIDRFGQDHPEVLTLVTDARGITYPTFLQSLARELVKVALEKLLQADVTTGQRLERALRELG
ncbi:MAG TPA: ATP-binding protein, partial [Myxococcota bacterium]|nr:ATP-binding protein [Myxococcota bacterium]